MSTPQSAPPRPSGPATGARGPGAILVNAGMPAEKSMAFWTSARRVLRRLGPDRRRVALVVALTTASVGCAVVGPRILGRATDLIFAGVIGRQLPPGITQDQAEAAARARGDDGLADLLSGMTVTPGQGIDGDALASTLMLAVGLYVVASLLMLVQGRLLAGVVQRATYQLRSDVEDKLHRLPLRYFDTQPRGELLSRVTNDIDNLQQTMQQTFSQMLNSVLTLLGVLTMMVIISPLLAIIALVSVPLSVVVTRLVAKRSQPLFVNQWAHTGRLNAHVEESFTGHAVVRAFGRQDEAEEVFRERNDELYQASLGSQFLSGLILPAITFIGNLNYLLVAVVGGLRVASGAMSLGEVQAFIQYSRQFSQPLTMVASMSNVLQSGVASAERVFELLDAEEQVPENTAAVTPDETARARGVRARVVPLRPRRAADRGPVARRAARPVGRDRRPDRRRQDHPGQPGHALLRARRRPHHPRRAGHRRDAARRPAR